ncbi:MULTISPECIES: hypothetical protein [Halorussus]|uniref:hypothetical protein n=1 Tax=Halorussus TaxID=1070314 RepID=UPI0020A15162|nr:hypothetical protein [Halorussus vallis]USZ77830.1 hypothetical protein NGM07_21860 [Halorussus vallis]
MTILCVIGFLGATVSLFEALGVMGGGPFAGVGLLMLALVVAKILVLYGLWTLQYWGYKWALVSYGLSAFLSLVTFKPLALILDVILVVYLLSVADHFR